MLIKHFSPKDIITVINNALALSSRPDAGEIGEGRLRRLSEYAQAVVKPCEEHIAEELLSAQELVVVLLSCALLVQAGLVPEEKVPLLNLAKKLKKK